MVVWGDLTNKWQQKRSESQGRKGKLYSSECRVPENRKERYESLLKWTVQRNRGKQWNGKDRRSLQKTGGIKETFSCMMDTIKDRKGKHLKEAELKRRWQEYTEELYKKGLNDNHDGVVTHPETDILVCEVKWVLQSITWNKVSGGDGIPGELFQILNYDAVKVLHSICQQIWKAQQWLQDWKRSIFIPIPKKSNAKEC